MPNFNKNVELRRVHGLQYLKMQINAQKEASMAFISSGVVIGFSLSYLVIILMFMATRRRKNIAFTTQLVRTRSRI